MPNTNHFTILSTLVSISIASAKIRKLTVSEPKRTFEMRPQLHLILQSKTGSVKSTILNEISSLRKPYLAVTTGITMPAVVGTIDSKDKKIIPPVTWDCRNSTLLLDEFKYTDKSDLIQALLQLLERREYSRRLGLFILPSKKKDKDLYFMAKNGCVSIKTRFNMIMATMHSIDRSKDTNIQALENRCLLYKYELSRSELREVAEGNRMLHIVDYDIDNEVKITKETYKKIVNLVHNSDVNSGHYLRTIGDCCRAYAVTKNDKIFNLIIDIHSHNYQNISKGFRDSKNASP